MPVVDEIDLAACELRERSCGFGFVRFLWLDVGGGVGVGVLACQDGELAVSGGFVGWEVVRLGELVEFEGGD